MKRFFDTTWNIFIGYLLILLLMICANVASAQSLEGDGVEVVQFNASFNAANSVKWVKELTDCEVRADVDIASDSKAASKNKIVVVPTIIIYQDGEEVKRFQANIMMTMEATKEEIQGYIDEILMESF